MCVSVNRKTQIFVQTQKIVEINTKSRTYLRMKKKCRKKHLLR